MSNVANKNGEQSEPLKVLSSISDETKSSIEKVATDVVDAAEPAAPEIVTSSAQTPHLVVVAPDALNAERMGPRLRAAREAKDWTLEAAAKETRIHKDYLSAIEDMMPNLLPGMPKSQSYLRGYLNNYARSLGLSDPQDVVQRFLNECGLLAMEPTDEELAIQAKQIDDKAKRSWVLPVIGVLAGLLVAGTVGGLLVMKPWEQAEETRFVASAPVVENTVYTNSEMMAPASSVADLSLHAISRAWIEVRGSDGTVYLSRELAPGDVYVPRVGAGWTITARDGGAFEWYRSGQSLGLLAEDGAPVYSDAVDDVLKRQPIESNDLTN